MLRGRSKHEGLKQTAPVCDHDDYTADEIQFMMAMDAWKREKQRPFPTWSEVLAVAKSLGYRKPEKASGSLEEA